jgi:endonuclease-3
MRWSDSMPQTSRPKASFAKHHTESPLWPKVDADLKEKIGRLPRNPKLTNLALRYAEGLQEEFPKATCALNYNNPLELLVATILSAQCTDERVNQVTPALFARYKTAEQYAAAPEGELEILVKSTGFFNSKAKSIRMACGDIAQRYGGEVPGAIEELLTLRGVARKTANVVRIHCFGFPGLTVDTHFKRLSARMGLTEQTDPEKIEQEIANLLPPERWTHFSNSIILHGRKTCKARKPDCHGCRFASYCPSALIEI